MKTSALATIVLAALAAAPAANAYEKGDWVVRGGVTVVAPDDSTSTIMVGANDLGVDLSVNNDTQLGLNLAYFITDNINIELLAATPFKHDVDFGAEDPLSTGNQVGEIKHLPPTLSINYYFNYPTASQGRYFFCLAWPYHLAFAKVSHSTIMDNRRARQNCR